MTTTATITDDRMIADDEMITRDEQQRLVAQILAEAPLAQHTAQDA